MQRIVVVSLLLLLPSVAWAQTPVSGPDLGVDLFTHMPLARSDGAVARWGDAAVYIGGYGGPGRGWYLDSVDVVRPDGTSETLDGVLPTPRSSVAAASYGDAVYIVGGTRPQSDGTSWGGTNLDEVLRLRPGEAAEAVATLPSRRTAAVAVAAHDGVYVFGGETEEGRAAVTDEVVRIDPETAEVAVVGHLPVARAWMAAAAIGSSVYLFGGWSPLDGDTADILRYDLASGDASVVGQLPQPLEAANAVWDGHVVWLLGGKGPGGERATALLFDPATGAVVTTPVLLPHPAEKVRAVRLDGCIMVLGGEWRTNGHQEYLDTVSRIGASCGLAAVELPDLPNVADALDRLPAVRVPPLADVCGDLDLGDVVQQIVDQPLAGHGSHVLGRDAASVRVQALDDGAAVDVKVTTGGSCLGELPFIDVRGDVTGATAPVEVRLALPDDVDPAAVTLFRHDGDGWVDVRADGAALAASDGQVTTRVSTTGLFALGLREAMVAEPKEDADAGHVEADAPKGAPGPSLVLAVLGLGLALAARRRR